MARWAIVLNRRTDWIPIVYLTAAYLDRHMGGCRADGIKIITPDAPAISAAPLPPRQTVPGASRTLRSRLRSVPLLRQAVGAYRDMPSPLAVVRHLTAIREARHRARALIREHSIGVTFIAESSAVHGAEAYIDGAHREGVPVVTAPIEKQLGHHEAENYLYDRTVSVERPINKLLGRLFPRWVLHHKGVRMVRGSPELIMAQELLGIAPPNPWRVVGNGEDMLALDSESTVDHYARDGVPRHLMCVVGHAEHDLMAEARANAPERRAELYERLGLPPARPMLLSPLVVDHYVSGRPECDFQEYRDLAEFWVRSLAAVKTHNVVISLHPGHTYRHSADAWGFLEELGVRIATDDLPLLVPLCDFYVAAGYSTTTQWAIACAKPVVNYDVYRYAMPIYESTPGVLTVTEQSDFVSVLQRLSNDRKYYDYVAARQAESAEAWGILDGQAGRRLADVFDALAQPTAKPGEARP